MIIDHFSASSLLLYLNNPSAWQKKYILGIRDQKTNPSALVGTAFHEYVKLFLRKQSSAIARDTAERMIIKTTDVDWGKTGSREKSLSDLNNLISYWHAEYKMNGEVIEVEGGHVLKVPYIKIPLMGYVDCVVKRNEKLVIIDWKTVHAFDEELQPSHIIQSYFYKWLIKKSYGQAPSQAEFVQIKTSHNKDNSPQIKIFTQEFPAVDEQEQAVKQLVNDVLKEVNKKHTHFFPNLRDQYEGNEEWKRYLNNFKTKTT